MSKYFRYVNDQLNIKLQRLGKSERRNRYYHIPVAGCNDFSREWLELTKNSLFPNDNWTDLIPWEDSTSNSFNAVTKNPCNLPGDKVR